MGSSTSRQSSKTSPPPTFDQWPDWWILSLVATRAKHTQLLGKERELVVARTCGQTPDEPYVRLDQPLSSGRTPWDGSGTLSSESYLTYKQWDTKLRRQKYGPPPSWVRDILGNDSSYLPTPKNRTGDDAQTHSGKRHRTVDDYLATPSVASATGGQTSRGGTRRGEKLLQGQLGGPANPEWIEWFIGLPIGWTDLEPLATESFQRWLRGFSGVSE